MNWVVLGVWIGAVVAAVLVLGFCAYELIGKARRLRADVGRLLGLAKTLTALQADVQAAQRRLTSAPRPADR